MILNILLWCLFGLIAGAVAQYIMPGKSPGESADAKGFLITTALGIVGAVVGGYLSSRLFGWDVTGFNLSSFAIAIIGALLLLFLYQLMAPARRRVIR
jgi:uncharacterized membrane protein YeaQ/YmgE (transglycosylase-associated protein family)